MGDSLIRHVHGHFHPSERGAPGFISYGGMKFEDVTAALEYLPPTVETLVLHVGTADIAESGSSSSLEKLRRMLARVRLHRPALKRICLSLPLPRTLNRRRRGGDWRFVRSFNCEASHFVREVRRLCQRKELGADVRYIDHAFHELPARRVFAADGLHASFEGVALLAEHFRNALSFRALGWQRRPFKPRAPNNPTPGATPAQRERQRAPPSPEVSPTTAVTPKTSPRRPNGTRQTPPETTDAGVRND